MFKQKLKNISLFTKLWLLAPIAIWFSYHPTIRLAEDSTAYYELSLTVIFLVVHALAGLPIVWKEKAGLLKRNSVRLVLLFFFISLLSLLWTANATRGFLTVGLLGVIGVIFLASLAKAEELRQSKKDTLRILIASSMVMSILAIVQMIAAAWFSSDVTLLCRGCVAEQFGFARPNVFSIEPQFFGNMLLAPCLILFHLLVKSQFSRLVAACFAITTLGLFLTMSRGAISSYGIGIIVLTALYHADKIALVKVYALLAFSFTLCLLVQGSVAAANPNLNTTFNGAISTSINQLTLGVVDISTDKGQSRISPVQSDRPGESREPNVVEAPLDNSGQPLFDGYVEESTNVRLTLTQLSLEAWAKNLGRLMFGVGTGGAGVVLLEEFPTRVNPREIVQNQYAEVLLENGLIGFTIFISIIVSLFYSLRQHEWSWAVLTAFLVQWNFFSGYPNALHIYLVCIYLFVAFGFTRDKGREKPTS
tara:strand:+ start:3968 stop:5398 length:1431 start_codon:yes stop_codon:yes gene_type:complete